MSFKTIIYEEDGPIGWIKLNRPDDGNMFTHVTCHEIRDLINDIRRETRTRVIVFTGAGDIAYRDVMHLLDVIRKNGVQAIGIR